MDKKLANEYKSFLIKLLKNGEYFDESYHVGYVGFSYMNGDDKFTVHIQDKHDKPFIGASKTIKVEGFNYSVIYEFCYDNFRFFNKINLELYNEVMKVKKKIDTDDYNRKYSSMNESIPSKYLRLKKINKLMGNDKG